MRAVTVLGGKLAIPRPSAGCAIEDGFVIFATVGRLVP